MCTWPVGRDRLRFPRAGRRSAAVFCATVAADVQTSVPASICGQVPAVLRKPSLLGLRQFTLRGVWPCMAPAPDHSTVSVPTGTVCSSALLLLASWLADRPVAATRHKRAASGPFSGAATSPKAAVAGRSMPRSRSVG